MMLFVLLPFTLLPFTLATSSVEIRTSAEFEDLVSRSSRVWMVEFYSEACGYCGEFLPTWTKLTAHATRLESGRVNIDVDTGMELANQLGVLDQGIPAVLIFQNQQQTLMAGELFPLSRLLKRVYRTTRGLPTDEDGYFLKA